MSITNCLSLVLVPWLSTSHSMTQLNDTELSSHASLNIKGQKQQIWVGMYEKITCSTLHYKLVQLLWKMIWIIQRKLNVDLSYTTSWYILEHKNMNTHIYLHNNTEYVSILHCTHCYICFCKYVETSQMFKGQVIT